MEQLKQSVFRINTSKGTGTGFLLKEQKIIITNFHVVDGFHKVSVETVQNKKYLANVFYINPKKDIAFISVSNIDNLDAESGIENISLDEVKQRNKVMVLGYPFGMPFTVTEGTISNPSLYLDDSKYIQTDAAVNPGNSGGPILDEQNNLVGVITSKFNNADNVGFAIPMAVLQEELELVEELDQEKFSVGCNNCGSHMDEAADYCNSCGSEMDATLFEELSLTELSQKIERSIEKMNVNPVIARSGVEYWKFHMGSAEIRIFVYHNEYLFVTSPLNKLPRKNLGEIYEYLLKEDVSPYRLSISDSIIYLSYRIHLSDLYSDFEEEILKDISYMATKADDLDDMFVNEFGAEMSHYSNVESE